MNAQFIFIIFCFYFCSYFLCPAQTLLGNSSLFFSGVWGGGGDDTQREASLGRHFAVTYSQTLYQIVSDTRISHCASPCSADSPGDMSPCPILRPE